MEPTIAAENTKRALKALATDADQKRSRICFAAYRHCLQLANPRKVDRCLVSQGGRKIRSQHSRHRGRKNGRRCDAGDYNVDHVLWPAVLFRHIVTLHVLVTVYRKLTTEPFAAWLCCTGCTVQQPINGHRRWRQRRRVNGRRGVCCSCGRPAVFLPRKEWWYV